MEIRYLYSSRFNKSWYFYFLDMFQWIEKYFCVSNRKIRSFNFKVYLNRFLYLHTFLRKTLWKLFDPFITCSLQMWRMNYRYISKSFSVFCEEFLKTLLGCPFGGTCLQPVDNTAQEINYIIRIILIASNKVSIDGPSCDCTKHI